MQLAPITPRLSVKESAGRLRREALRDGGAGVWATDARGCRLVEEVAQLLAEDIRVALVLRGHPRVDHRILTVWPAGSDEPVMGGWMPDYGTKRPERKRPLGPWERKAIIDQAR